MRKLMFLAVLAAVTPVVSDAASAEVRSESCGARMPKPLLKIAVMSDIQDELPSRMMQRSKEAE